MTNFILKPIVLCCNNSLNRWANKLLQQCCQSIVSTCKDHNIDSIILTGSFSRGESSIFWENNTPVLAGDIEFLLVSKKTGTLVKDRAFYEKFKTILGEQVSKSMGSEVEVDIGLVDAGYFSKKLSPSIFGYDLVNYGKTLYGVDYLDNTIIRKKDIPQEDALALLMNRTIELLILSENKSRESYHYQLVKILLDMAGSILAFTGNYAAPYKDRPKALRKLLRDRSSDMQGLSIPDLPDLVEQAAQLKLKSEPNEAIQKAIILNDIKIQNYLAQLIYWQMKQIIGSSGDMGFVINKYFSQESLLTVFKGWIKYFIHPFRSSDGINFFLLPKTLIRVSPRNLIYSSAMKYFLGTVFGHHIKKTAGDDLHAFNRGYDPKRSIIEVSELWGQVIKHN
ncbi:hypothetical protein [uncultured Desulfobacter sp.]|uniref:hypothetical protein n=1 Tax=uncultured Desulfobacter sp. TaxID=240139 RepID=UPI002AA8FE18|nr:hypothetical protein [uncultured Desulfobacter sp.]